MADRPEYRRFGSRRDSLVRLPGHRVLLLRHDSLPLPAATRLATIEAVAGCLPHVWLKSGLARPVPLKSAIVSTGLSLFIVSSDLHASFRRGSISVSATGEQPVGNRQPVFRGPRLSIFQRWPYQPLSGTAIQGYCVTSPSSWPLREAPWFCVAKPGCHRSWVI